MFYTHECVFSRTISLPSFNGKFAKLAHIVDIMLG